MHSGDYFAESGIGNLVCVTVHSGDDLNRFRVHAACFRVMPGDARGHAGTGGWTRHREDSCTLMQFDAIALQHYFVKVYNVVVLFCFFLCQREVGAAQLMFMLLLFHSKALYLKVFMLNQLLSEFCLLQVYCVELH